MKRNSLKLIKNLIIGNKFIYNFILKPIRFLIINDSKLTRFLSKESHRRLMFVNLHLNKRQNWFDHQIDKNFQWQEKGDIAWLERGVFSSICLKPSNRVLELCCGDGFHASNFYSNKCKEIISCDIDRYSIKHANNFYKKINITYIVNDIISNMPKGTFDNIIWDIAFSFSDVFNKKELDQILSNIKNRLNKDGILSGCTLKSQERSQYNKSRSNSYPITNKKDLFDLLQENYKYVFIFEIQSIYSNYFYFWCSESTKNFPFSKNWNSSISNIN